MESYQQLQKELLNEKAKLAKMTSTVKQLGTKLKEANENSENLGSELAYYKSQYILLKGGLSKLITTKDEAHTQALIIESRKGFKAEF